MRRLFYPSLEVHELPTFCDNVRLIGTALTFNMLTGRHKAHGFILMARSNIKIYEQLGKASKAINQVF